MFDIGFWELAIIAIVGVVVVGPDRLPEVVRTVAITLRKLRRMFSDVKADISRELDLDNMRKFIQETEVEEHIKQLNQSVIDMSKDADISNTIKDVGRTIEDSRQAVKDIFNDPESAIKAKEQADTGVEPVRLSRFDDTTTPNTADSATSNTETNNSSTDKPFSTDNQSS